MMRTDFALSFLALACSAFGALPAIAAAPVMAPFHAEYATLQNGDELGQTTLDLHDNGDGTWTLRSETKGRLVSSGTSFSRRMMDLA